MTHVSQSPNTSATENLGNLLMLFLYPGFPICKMEHSALAMDYSVQESGVQKEGVIPWTKVWQVNGDFPDQQELGWTQRKDNVGRHPACCSTTRLWSPP